MNRYDIINELINKHNYKTYLEIGVRNPDECFNLINCETKHSLDILKFKFSFFNCEIVSLLDCKVAIIMSRHLHKLV